jgi:hypothetical protein
MISLVAQPIRDRLGSDTGMTVLTFLRNKEVSEDIDMEEYREYEKMKAMNWLLGELDKGRVSGEQDGWLDADEVFRDIEARYHG